MKKRALALALGVGGMLACASVDVEPVPLCAPVASLQPLLAEGACEESALAEYASALSEQVVRPTSQALVRVEFDEAARVRSVCVDAGVGIHAWHARRDLAPKLDAIRGMPPGPACLSHRRFDFNRYQSKLAEIEEARRWCSVVAGYRMTALQPCPKFASDWILYDRMGSTRPYLYLKRDGSEPADVPASDTLRRCERTEWGFEAQSECVLAAGFQLLISPAFEMLAAPPR